MDILQYGAQLLRDQLGGNLDIGAIGDALKNLLGDAGGDLDLPGLAGRLAQSGELKDILGSWLGDGANAPVSADALAGILGGDRIAEFAGRLGVDAGTAAESLSEVLLQMIDKASSGGSLLDMAGGMEGVLGAAKSFFS
jgi:uncharacterized protein YidB (DUF937 family)